MKVSSAIISPVEVTDTESVTVFFLPPHLLQLIRGSPYQGRISGDLGFAQSVNLLQQRQVSFIYSNI